MRIGKDGHNIAQMNYAAARSTPTVEGDVLYALGSDGDLVCLQVADGKMRCEKKRRAEFEVSLGVWAYSESPLIDGSTLVCTPGGSNATIVALNKNSGE